MSLRLAFLGEKPENGEVGGMSVVAGADDLIDYCKSASLDEVIVAVADTQSKEMKPCFGNAGRNGTDDSLPDSCSQSCPVRARKL